MVVTLRHVYASLAEFNDTLITGGAAALTDDDNNAVKLEMLDEVSRLIDARCHRGSGFGPWVGTKYYNGDSRSYLFLRADIDELDTLTVASSTGVAPSTATVEDDFYLAGLGESYERPYRRIVFHGQGTITSLGSGLRTIAATGSWSYPYRTRLLTATLGDDLDNSATLIEVSAVTGLSAGLTILVDDEQMYVSVVTDDVTTPTITVERAVNGTTAATHDDMAAITRYVYDPSVNTCALRLAQKRWTAKATGANGTDDGGTMGTTTFTESEDRIINRMLGETVMLVGMV